MTAMKLINCENMILGRAASYAAKQALLGEEVALVNCEKAIVTGARSYLIEHYRHKFLERGNPHKGPFISKQPERYMRRVVRGMLPWDKARGQEAFKRVRCFIGMPEQFSKGPFMQLKNAHAEKLPTLKYMKLNDLLKIVGAKSDT